MKKSVLQGALMKLLGRAFDEMPEEIKEEAAADDSKTGDEDVNARLARVEEMLLKLCDVTGAADADPEAKPAEEKPAEAAPETPVVTDADPTAPATPTEGESDVGARLAAIEAALAKLLETKAAAAATDSAPLADAETLARAEILVPGIVNSGTLIKDALDQFGQTESGKKVLATLDSIPEEGSKFVAAAELVKSQRQGALALTVDSFAGLHRNDPKAMTPEKLNEANAKRWNQQ